MDIDYEKRESILVNTQEQLDKISTDFDGEIYISGGTEGVPIVVNRKYRAYFFVLSGVVEFYKDARITVQGSAIIYTYAECKVVAKEESKVFAYNNSSIQAFDYSEVTLYDDAVVEIYDLYGVKVGDFTQRRKK